MQSQQIRFRRSSPTTMAHSSKFPRKSGQPKDHFQTRQLLHTTPYHPQSNGLIERVHKVIKTAFRALEEPEEWVNQLPLIELAFNNQVSDTNCFTPYQKTFGTTCRMPGTLLLNNTVDEISNLSKKNKNDVQIFCELMSYHQRNARPLQKGKSQIEED